MEKIVIAIDGYSGCGKSTTAKTVSQLLKYLYIDTGAMYRAVTLYFLDHYINLTNPKQVAKSLAEIEVEFERQGDSENSAVFLNGTNVSHRIRSMEVSDKVSEVSALAPVREKLVAQQRKIGKRKGVVMDGRDIGTVVFPNAELKIFMTADLDVRAARRQVELLERGQLVNLDKIMENLVKRDQLDTTRSISPLKRAQDAHLIDTTHLTFSEQVEEILNLATSSMVKMGHHRKITQDN
ncbi:MAG: cytidylate kinase [Cyclobacteriaceae bacterium]|nr:MAG: cytidylate kinase [Cyclobacteriaceae bacterium]